MAKVARCVSHCRSCDRCFHGDRAFDLHRQGSHQAGARRCVHPLVARDRKGNQTLVAGTVEGRCGLSKGFSRANPRDGVTIWVAVKGLGVGARFAAKRAEGTKPDQDIDGGLVSFPERETRPSCREVA
jgi:hypothetical protein